MPLKSLSPDEIRAIDGPQLTRLAFTLGLAPEGSLPDWPSTGDVYDSVGRTLWEPHSSLTQARVVFFEELRARGWGVQYEWDGRPGCQAGLVTAEWWEAGGSVSSTDIRFGAGERYPEAHALLLVSCLALASVQAP